MKRTLSVPAVACLAMSLVASLVMACSKQAESTAAKAGPTASQEQTPPQESQSQATLASASRRCLLDADCASNQLCVRDQCVDITAGLAECSPDRINFAYDSSEISAADLPKLDRMARCLKTVGELRVVIEGNTDERGTDEYNLALGQRRADEVEKYLKRFGVTEQKLKSISYGKERPVCQEQNEECWAQNRRAAINPKK